jgi:hypothetical protein
VDIDIHTFYMVLGFTLAAYSVVANDSIQTLGPWIASNSARFKWYHLWAATSSVLLVTLWYGWTVNGGDISFGRLNSIPFQEVQWYHALAPLILLWLTKKGIPVSTSFLVLSAFASTFVLEKMLAKSILGYALAAGAAYIIWFFVAKHINEKRDKIEGSHKKLWLIAQWSITGFLWFTWLSHDMANIAVFLPRSLSLHEVMYVSVIFVLFLGYTLKGGGGKIQEVVLDKTGTRYIRSATIINLVYAFILLFFKEYNDIPMSTTWVFVGLLSGRELAISRVYEDYRFKNVFPLIRRDFYKMMFGLGVSVGIVIAIHYIIAPV